MATILFPTDFSPTANNAFQYALNLARVIGADLRIVTVKTHLKEYLNLQQNEFDQKIKELQDIALGNNLTEVKMTSSLEVGDLILTILDIIRKEQIDYVVMGTNGENSFGKKFFGSQTIALINNSPVPVLAVPHGVDFVESRKFAYATMWNTNEEAAIRQMLSFSERHHSKLDIVHVEKKTLSIDEIMKKREWEVEFPEANFEVIKNDDVDSALIDYCENHQIDVLGLMYRELNPFQRLFSESHSKRLLTEAQFAILVLKSK